MEKFNKFLGISGIILFVFGIISFVLVNDWNLYNIFHISAGLILMLYFLVVNFSGLGDMATSRSTKFASGTLVFGGVVFAIIVVVNILVYAYPKRFDLTENKLYSLSDQTRKVVKMLPENTEMFAFFAAGQAGPVEDLLKAYSYISPKLTYEIIDPEKSPALAEQFQVNRDKTIVVVMKGRTFKATVNTEQGITNALLKLVKGAHKTVYFIKGHGEHLITNDQEVGYSMLKKGLEDDNFTVKELFIPDAGQVPDDADVIIVASPQRDLFPEEIEAIDKYLKKGKSAIFLFDPGIEGGVLGQYVNRWGIKLDPDVIIDKNVKLFGSSALGVLPVVSDFGASTITKDFDKKSVIFPLVSSIERIVPQKASDDNSIYSNTEITDLAKTSASSWGETNLNSLFKERKAEIDDNDIKGPMTVAVSIEKKLKGSKEKNEGDKSIKIIIAGDSDFVANKYVRNMYNMDLFLNMVNWTAGEGDFIYIRPKNPKISRVNFTENQMEGIFYLSVLILPELLMLMGILVWIKRR